MLAWVVGGHSLEVVDEGLLAVGDVDVVLGVGVSGVAVERLGWLALVEHQVVERLDGVLVALQVGAGHEARIRRGVGVGQRNPVAPVGIPEPIEAARQGRDRIVAEAQGR